MADNKTVFISLIGMGRGRQEGSKGYEKTYYQFEETNEIIYTSFFGSSLYDVLIRRGYDVDKWLIFGTNQSSWSELLYILKEEQHDDLLELYDRVYDGEDKGISGELLKQWEETLQNFMPGIRLIMVDPLDYEIYINHMIMEIPNEPGQIVLDITHAFRHMPVVIAFSLMALKHLKDISDIMVYYGAFELKKDRNDENEPAPVLKIDFINTLVSYAENLAIFNNSGYFPPLLDEMGIPNTEETYFGLEMNRQPRHALRDINSKLVKKSSQNDYEAVIAEYLKEEIVPLLGATLDMRMVERAKFFFDKKQYLKALILLYEGIIVAIGMQYKFGDPLEYKTAENTEKYINKNQNKIFKDSRQYDLYCTLKNTRNAATHGSRGKREEVERCVNHQVHFETLFNEGLELYEWIVGDRSC